jgi:hypothetical protein
MSRLTWDIPHVASAECPPRAPIIRGGRPPSAAGFLVRENKGFNEPRHRRHRPEGRHARPGNGLRPGIGFLFRKANRRHTIVAMLSMVAVLGLFSVAVATVRAVEPRLHSPAPDGAEDRTTRALPRPAAPQVGPAKPGGQAAGDASAAAALTYLRRRDTGAGEHAKDVRWSGDYLRIYTDLSPYDDNSPAAVSLCESASSYLTDQLGRDQPIVFVHAEESGNGHVVLANRLEAGDSCEVGAGS